jgi:bile acid:Na+ symporter, BASS family
VERIAGWITRLFPLWAVLFSGAALVWPAAFTWFSGSAIQWGLAAIMLGMGLTLTVDDFRPVLARPKPLALGVGLQFSVMPLLGFGIGWALDLPREMAVGLILVACCPGGTASNVIAFLARADVALSVSMTSVSTLASVVMTPLLTRALAGRLVDVDVWGLLQSIVLIVLLPVAAGALANQYLRATASRLSKVSPVVSVVFIVLIVGSIMGANRDAILEHWRVISLAVLALHAGGFGLGYALAALFGPPAVARTASIEVGMQNSGLGAALARQHFPDLPLAPVPCAMSAVAHCLLGSLLAAWWRNRPLPERAERLARPVVPAP